MRRTYLPALLLGAALWTAGLAPALAVNAAPPKPVEPASIERIRLHEGDAPKVVLDLTRAAKLTVIDTPSGPAVRLQGVAPAYLDKIADAHNPYLRKVTIIPAGESDVLVGFDRREAFRLIAYPIPPDQHGGHRIVLELKADPGAQATNAAVSPKPLSAADLTVSKDPKTPPEIQAEEAFNQGQLERACALVDQHFGANSWNMRAMMVRAHCLAHGGKTEDAIALLTRLLEFDPEFNRARLALANLQYRDGDRDAALANYRQVLNANPPPAVAAEILQRMDKATNEAS
ncbi:MAG: tetratricopeptide repeat protein [Pseudomonadota bacterium]